MPFISLTDNYINARVSY